MSKYKLPKVEELLSSGVHFGHQVRRWHPKMEPYIYGVKNNIHIFNLEDTEKGLKKACEFLYEIAKNGGQIIFVGTKKQARDIVQLEAKRSGALYVTERWLGGTMTNFRVIRKNADKLLNLIKRRETGDLGKYTKKERLLIDRQIEKLEKYYGGIVTLKGTPGAIFVVDGKREKTSVRESARANVPVVGLIDTNTDPSQISHVIPGNDDAIKSIAIIIKSVADAVAEGYKEHADKIASAAAANAAGVAPVALKVETTEKTPEKATAKTEEKPAKATEEKKPVAKEVKKEAKSKAKK